MFACCALCSQSAVFGLQPAHAHHTYTRGEHINTHAHTHSYICTQVHQSYSEMGKMGAQQGGYSTGYAHDPQEQREHGAAALCVN